MTQKVKRSYLEIKSVLDLKEVVKPSYDYTLNLILDKNYLINKINSLDERIIDESFINYKINENGNEISVFFDNQSFNLIGWQTKDVYQNLNITFLSSVKKNELINKNIFKLPSQN